MSKEIKDITEKEVQAKITKWLAKHPNLWFTKSVQMSQNGVPDLIVCYKGRFVALEVKRPVGGKVSTLQQIQINSIIGAGGTARVVRSLDDAIEIINEIDARLKMEVDQDDVFS